MKKSYAQMSSTQARTTEEVEGEELTDGTQCSKEIFFTLVHNLDLAELFASTIVSSPVFKPSGPSGRCMLISGLRSMSLRGDYEHV